MSILVNIFIIVILTAAIASVIAAVGMLLAYMGFVLKEEWRDDEERGDKK